VLLDEAVLEHEGLDLVADLDPLDAGGRRDHRRGAGGQEPGVAEVAGEAGPQRLGLAHVDDPSLAVLELVGPRGVGDGPRRRSLEHGVRV
jgi:hypothetical protein